MDDTDQLPGSGSPTPSSELPRLGAWQRGALALAQAYHLDDVAEELRLSAERERRPSFRVAVVGEPTRGKSALLNRLLDADVLPTGQIPTTSTVISLAAGVPARIVLSFPDGSTETRPLEPPSWSDLVGTDVTGSGDPRIHVFVDRPWLGALDAELVDTPGVDSVVGERAAIVQQVISESDVVLMTVGATSPLSVTELAFLREEVIGHHIPRVLVVVTMLDRLRADEREQTVAAIDERVHQLSSEILVLPAPMLDDDSEPLERLRSALRRLTARDRRAQLRGLRVAWQLADHLERMVQVGREGAEAARLDQQALAQAVRRAEQRSESQRLAWEGIQLELEGRRIELQRRIVARIEASRQVLARGARDQLTTAGDVKSWCAQELPLWLRRELTAVARELETSMRERLESDLRWVEDALSERLEEPPERRAHGDVTVDRIEPSLDRVELRADIGRYRWYSRITAGAGLVLSAIFFRPIAAVVGGAASIFAGLAAERLLDRLDAGQRGQVAQELDGVIDSVLKDYERQVGIRVKALYGEAAEGLVRTEAAWQASREQAVRSGASGGGAGLDWDALIRDASELRAELLGSLGEARAGTRTGSETEEATP